MNLIVKTFEELSTKELYEILKSRAEIFVVEQNCVYQDIDDIDLRSLHVFYQDGAGRAIAYLRLFQKANCTDTIQMGRVLTIKHGFGLGGKILHEGVSLARAKMGAKRIYLEAQTYAIGFYEREGFKVCSEEFLEDGIPHVKMIWNIN